MSILYIAGSRLWILLLSGNTGRLLKLYHCVSMTHHCHTGFLRQHQRLLCTLVIVWNRRTTLPWSTCSLLWQHSVTCCWDVGSCVCPWCSYTKESLARYVQYNFFEGFKISWILFSQVVACYWESLQCSVPPQLYSTPSEGNMTLDR